MRIWYHGTNERAAALIQAEGFSPWTYFAANLQDAIEFGGEYVFQVRLEFSDPVWQMRVSGRVTPEKIVALTHYQKTTILDFPERRKEVFDFNMNKQEAPK